MSELPHGSDAALEPLRAALRASSASEAATIAAKAEADAGATLARARDEARDILRTARQEGRAAARRAAEAAEARVRRRAAETVLAARSRAAAQLDAAILREVAALKDDRDYAALEQRLRDRAVELLGPGAVIEEAPEGGILASAGSRRIDAGLDALAAEAARWAREQAAS